ncbi:Uncharacterised protein [Suttonella ornithocola]|uniref:Uncharacterized protein n=1 Tax=Suttonella ornithocola TaxID=279832 RepID=A0A380MRD7_9GAMM|nr:Uncharacterised protein [Suttonella ornithocola]
MDINFDLLVEALARLIAEKSKHPHVYLNIRWWFEKYTKHTLTKNTSFNILIFKYLTVIGLFDNIPAYFSNHY